MENEILKDNQNLEEENAQVKEQEENNQNQGSDTEFKVDFKELLKNKEFASEFDKRISNAINTAKDKWEAESKMTAEELANKKFEESKSALEQREKEFELREFRADLKEQLISYNLPLAFADVLAVGTTRDDYQDILNQIKQEWDNQMQEQIKAKARQVEPRAGGYQTGNDNNINLDLAELAKKNRKI